MPATTTASGTRRSRGWFTGDTFGLSYPELDAPRGRYLLPTTTPVQFEPDALKTSVSRMLERQPECMYLTHYGRVGDVARLGALLMEQVDAMVEIATAHAAPPTGRHASRKRSAGSTGRRLRIQGSTLADRRSTSCWRWTSNSMRRDWASGSTG